MRTCALCGWRDAVDLTDYDGRKVPACGVCLEPPDVADDFEYEPADLMERFGENTNSSSGNHTTHNAIVIALRSLKEATTGEIAEVIGCTDINSRQYDTLVQGLRRMRKKGEVEATTRVDAGCSRGFKYRLTSKANIMHGLATARCNVVEAFGSGLTAREVAVKLGMTYSAVNASLHRAARRGEIEFRGRGPSLNCTTCGKRGHNSRTCWEEEKAA